MPDALDMILHWVFPTDCAVCKRPAVDRRLPFFCRDCWETIRPIEGPVCPRCGRPFDSPLALTSSPGHRCGPCRKKLPVFDRALSPYRYEGVLEKAVHLFKYRRSEEHTSELQSRLHLVCRLLLEKKKEIIRIHRCHRTADPSQPHLCLSTGVSPVSMGTAI